MGWDVRFNKGVHLPQAGLWLDARRGMARAFVSHAHSDHIAGHREVICTAATARFMQARLPGRRRQVVLPFDRPKALEFDCTSRLFPAGHILGSAMLHLTSEHGALLYTGDFKTRPNLVAEPCVFPRADVLIMETTFALPRYVFPPSAQVHAAIIDFCRETLAGQVTPVLLAYSLGKSQELLQLVGGAGLPVQLHRQAHTLTRLHADLGVRLPPFAEFSPERHRGHVVIAPPQSEILSLIHPRRTAVATGWALDPGAIYRYGCDVAFPLSDHAGYDDLLAFVDRVQPRVVYTLHGFAREFAATLRARGTEAWAIGRGNQLELSL